MNTFQNNKFFQQVSKKHIKLFFLKKWKLPITDHENENERWKLYCANNENGKTVFLERLKMSFF